MTAILKNRDLQLVLITFSWTMSAAMAFAGWLTQETSWYRRAFLLFGSGLVFFIVRRQNR